jgi:hypothetical protein
VYVYRRETHPWPSATSASLPVACRSSRDPGTSAGRRRVWPQPERATGRCRRSDRGSQLKTEHELVLRCMLPPNYRKRGTSSYLVRPEQRPPRRADPPIVWRRGRTRQTSAGPLQIGTGIRKEKKEDCAGRHVSATAGVRSHLPQAASRIRRRPSSCRARGPCQRALGRAHSRAPPSSSWWRPFSFCKF